MDEDIEICDADGHVIEVVRCLSCRNIGPAREILDDADFPDGYPVCGECGCQLVEPVPHNTGLIGGTPSAAAPLLCVCGCGHFVWWVNENARYSSSTPRECYHPDRHPDARCRRCNREVRPHNTGLTGR